MNVFSDVYILNQDFMKLNTMKLVKPSSKYKTSYLSSLWEEKRQDFPVDYIKGLEEDFPGFLEKIRTPPTGEYTAADGKNYAIDTQYIYWLIDKTEFIGDISLRPSLNDFMRSYGGHIGYRIRPSKRKQGLGTKILKMALEIASIEYAMDRVYILCRPDNISSRTVIEKNGGALLEMRSYDWCDYQMCVYSIKLIE